MLARRTGCEPRKGKTVYKIIIARDQEELQSLILPHNLINLKIDNIMHLAPLLHVNFSN